MSWGFCWRRSQSGVILRRRIRVSDKGFFRGLAEQGFVALTFGWALTLVMVPFLLAHTEEERVLTAVSAGTYIFAGVICHQLPERSFRPWGVQMPVCARCAGLYFGGAVGALVAGITRRRDSARNRVEMLSLRWVLLASALPTGMSFVAELGGWVPVGEELRAVASVPLGATVTWVASLVIRGELA